MASAQLGSSKQLLGAIKRSLKLSKDLDEIASTCNNLQSTIELLEAEPSAGESAAAAKELGICSNALLAALKSFTRFVDAYTHASSNRGDVSALSALFQRDLQLSVMNDQLKHLFVTTEPCSAMFGDVVAADFWSVHFGARARLVPTDDFVRAFCGAAESASISEESLHIIARYVDPCRINFVSTYTFRIFLRSFGPLPGSVSRLLASVDAGVLAGHISAVEASSLLSGRPRGAFLIRFSKSRPGSFAVTFVDSKLGVKHCLLFAIGPDRYGVTLRNPPDVFESLLDFVSAHRSRLSSPMGALVKRHVDVDRGSTSPGPYSHYLGSGNAAADAGAYSDDDSVCCICFDEPRDHLFLPCGHLAVGKRCAAKMNVCCVCRQEVTSKVKVFHV